MPLTFENSHGNSFSLADRQTHIQSFHPQLSHHNGDSALTLWLIAALGAPFGWKWQWEHSSQVLTVAPSGNTCILVRCFKHLLISLFLNKTKPKWHTFQLVVLDQEVKLTRSLTIWFKKILRRNNFRVEMLLTTIHYYLWTYFQTIIKNVLWIKFIGHQAMESPWETRKI